MEQAPLALRAAPDFSGSYDREDVVFLLKPSAIEPVDIAAKEALIQSGARHYSEMLSAEKLPDARYMILYAEALARNAGRLRRDIETLAEAIQRRPETARQCVIVSLARAGTPIGILLKRALARRGVAVHHYSVSIIRGRGIDRNALRRIREEHGVATAIFVDGWTGKGAIKGELERSLAEDGLGFTPFLAVVADPAGRADLAATTEDYVIPSGLLNGIVSGLISRSVLTEALVGPEDFHACLFQTQFAAQDLSRQFIADIEAAPWPDAPTGGWTPEAAGVARIASRQLVADLLQECGMTDVNRLKPGIAEATRAVLRRMPDRIYVKDLGDPEIQHLRHLAVTNGVDVVARDLHNYRAVTIIKNLGGDQA